MGGGGNRVSHSKKTLLPKVGKHFNFRCNLGGLAESLSTRWLVIHTWTWMSQVWSQGVASTSKQWLSYGGL